MQNKSKLELRAKPKQPVQINKPMVLAIIAVVVFVILLSIIYAFNTVKVIKANGAVKAVIDKPIVISAELNDLPSSYSDINAIQKYSSGQGGELTKLQQQFAELKNAYEFLEQQFRAASPSGPESKISDPRTEQARNSGVVFAGLGTGVENLVSPDSDRGGRYPFGQTPSSRQPTDLVATKQQEEFFKEQAENTQKIAVMKSVDKPEDIYDLHNVVKPVSQFQIQAGTVVPAALITGIDTTVAGTVVAQVRQNLYDTVTGKFLLIPRGSKLLGEYNSCVSYGQRRVMIVFERVIRPDGSSVLLGKPVGADLQGHSGVEGDVDNHWARVLGAATISTLLSIGAGVASDRYSKQDQWSSKQGAILGGAAGISDVGKNLANRAMDIPPTITLPAGYQFNVIIRRDMVLTLYKPRR